ncbi:MAG: sigma 54-interacting transcriptional regulator [Deltaproteobacteria bacterium]|nr:sigma 54-interacting transcriptional regulator [Deltaproteobacteria bacterium]
MIRSSLAYSEPPPCVGRDQDLDHILSALNTAQLDSLGGMVAVTGPPGIGKSMFLRAIERRTRNQATVVSAHCRAGLPPHRPLVDLIDGLLPQLPAGNSLPESALYLRDALIGTVVEDQPHRAMIYDQLAALFIAVAVERPLIVVLHDLAGADIVTRQAIEYLAATLSSTPEVGIRRFRGLLVASGNALENLGSNPSWSAGLNLLHLELSPLDRAGVRAYLGSEVIAARALELTGGSPHRLEALFAQAPPESLVLDASPVEREVLEVLALSARPLSVEALGCLCGQSEFSPSGKGAASSLKTSLQSWSKRGVLEKTVTNGELLIAFQRTGDEQVVYDAVSEARRCALHARLGKYLLTQGDDEAEAAARHLLAAKDVQGVALAVEAARRLEIVHCPERAAELYSAALPLAQDDQLLSLERALCRCHEGAGNLDHAIDIATLICEKTPSFEASLRLAELRLAGGDLASAASLLDKLVGTTADATLQVRALAAQAETRYLAGDSRAARHTAETGLALCPSVAPSEVAAVIRLRATLARLCWDAGDSDQAAMLFTDNLLLARSNELTGEEARALTQMASLQAAEGKHEEAGRSYHEAMSLATLTGDQRLLGACLQHLGVLADRRGRHTEAVAYYQRAVTSWKRVGHHTFLAWVSQDLGTLYLALNDIERGQAMAQLARRLSGESPAAALKENILLLEGELATAQHHHDVAEATFREALRLAESSLHSERARRAELALVRLYLRKGALEEAHTLLGAGALARPSLSGVSPRQRLREKELYAQLALAEARDDEAVTLWSETLEMARALEDLRLTWRCQAQLALLARSSGKLRRAQRWARQAHRTDAQLHQLTPAEFHAHLAEEPLRQRVNAIEPGRETAELSPVIDVSEDQPQGIIGQHPRMRQVLRQIAKVAPTDSPVLIRGESGTGKELVANALHEASPRADKPLIKINCGALVESLLISELFGHERGAFTGALQRRLGRFELADGGTLFLDEIGDISPRTQVALLRVLQERSFERVGGTHAINVNVRLIFATHRNLEQMVACGDFREDLYYRLRGVELTLPPLRERKSDLPRIAGRLLAQVASERNTPLMVLSESATTLLTRHRWPGNVRELDNVLRSVTLFAEGEELRAEDFSDFSEFCPASSSPAISDEGGDANSAYQELRHTGSSLREYKKRIEGLCISSALSDAGGNITHAAELLGMKRPRLSQLIKEHGLPSKEAEGKRDQDV